jgi:hypothetical protein
MRMRLTLTPATAAASGLLPVALTWRPKTVERRAMPPITATAAITSTCRVMSPMWKVLMSMKAVLTPEVIGPSPAIPYMRPV